MLHWSRFRLDEREFALVADDDGIRAIRFDGTPPAGAVENDRHPHLRELAEQLSAYFRGARRDFDLPLAPQGTAFQLSVWKALTAIPYGQTCSYQHIAEQIGKAKAVRAVGAANGANPLPIVVPCHRVIGSNGKLTGFGGGLPLKRFLLDLESENVQPLFDTQLR